MKDEKKNVVKNTVRKQVPPEGDTADTVIVATDTKPKKNKPTVDKKKNEVKKDLKQRFGNPFKFIYNERFTKTFGLTLLLFSVFLFIAFTSYILTWEVDQDKVVGNLFSPEVQVQNWLGKIGALLSHIFIYKWFGVSSYIISLLMFLTGVSITFDIRFFNTARTYAIGMFLLIFLSISLSFVLSSNLFLLGGGFGYSLAQKMVSMVGLIGTALVLVFVFACFLVVAYNVSFKIKRDKRTALRDTESTNDTHIENVNPATGNKFKNDYKPGPEPVIFENDIIPDTTVKEDIITQQEEDFLQSTPLIVPLQKSETINDILAQQNINNKQPTINDSIIISNEDDDVQFTVEKTPEKIEQINPDQIAEQLVAQVGEYDPTLDLSSYQFPPIDLLESYGGTKDITINTEELTANKDRILKTLSDYGIDIDKIKATVGPTVTLYEIIPAAGVRISKIKNLEDDIALSLSALGIRIIAPIPGKGTVGIEVPNQKSEMVPMRSILASEKFLNTNMDLPVALGKTISNEIFVTDLTKMPHLLMAGATGQGKSVGLNAILVSLLYKKHPSQIKFVLVDPKKVELTLFNKIERHFLAKLPDSAEAIITDTKKVIHTLNSLCIEMDQRYDLLKDAQVRNLREYNAKFVSRKLNPNNGHKFLPYIVLVVDEFADLIMTAGKEVETPIARLAQLARAIGIHLIIATQRPSVNIITGTIKANFPARIAFRVTSKIDSRTILDAGGAEQLIGRGDMLLSTGNDLIRLQCAFVDTPEVEKICEFIGEQRGYPTAFMLPEYIDENGEGSGKTDDPSQRDELFNQAAEIVVISQQGSASLLQRRLKLGYNRAGRIVDQLEAAGIIGPFEGSKAREVLIKDMASLEQFLNKSRELN